MFDKEIEKAIGFWQIEKSCVILLSQMGASTIMDVLFKESGEIDKGIYLGSRNASKDYIMVQMSKYFREV